MGAFCGTSYLQASQCCFRALLVWKCGRENTVGAVVVYSPLEMKTSDFSSRTGSPQLCREGIKAFFLKVGFQPPPHHLRPGL